MGERQYKEIIQKRSTLNETGSMEAVCFLTENTLKVATLTGKFVKQSKQQKMACILDQFKSVKPETRRPLRKLVFNVPTRRELSLGEKAITHGLAIASGVKHLRTW